MKQRAYTGRYPIIPSSLTNMPCTLLGVKGVLAKLNIILSTSEHTLEILSLFSVLNAYTLQGYDFGTIFSCLCPFWYNDLSDIADKLHCHEASNWQMRQDMLINNKIISGLLPSQCVSDLYSNRVIPWWVAWKHPSAISHAWMEKEDCADVETPINGNEWPVPMPKDANLNLIHIEMLNLGVEYAWLDILCLRQVGRQREDLHEAEWKVDVPTIGGVYRMSHDGVVCYLSGMGRPFSLKEEDLKSDRCWFRRAWTLQEIHHHMSIGGDTGDDRFISKEIDISYRGMPVFIILSEMQMRVLTNPVDKVAGLSYLLRTYEIPPYYASQSQEEAWTALVDEMRAGLRGHLFFLYPKAGDGKKSWQPSWKQAITEALPPPHINKRWVNFVSCMEENDCNWCDGPCIESGYVQGLDKESQEGKRREGELLVKDITGGKHTFNIITDHQYLIPEGLYTLVGSDASD
ncbi:hypothetical protein EDD18DRAFT_1080264 [Armillaria luteobubalina]|uniref:Heterokaryon incompatibility domain-containing protein n=1 Tax=Armillaria luteobubalina TaxID=153913 RepID=A0AA39UT97_9AGAR|nr:hypothetical protein EDD18DRAFT_1080264 [Armillaria luteobubalina]